MKYKWRQWKQLEKEISERNPKMLDLSSEAARKSWHLSPSPGDPCYLAAASPGEEELGTALPGAPPPPLQEEEPSPTDPNYVKIDEFAVSEVTAAAGDDGRGRRIGVGRRQISLRQIPHRQIPLRQIPIRQIPLTKIQTPINVTPANLTLTNPTLPFHPTRKILAWKNSLHQIQARQISLWQIPIQQITASLIQPQQIPSNPTHQILVCQIPADTDTDKPLHRK